MRIKINPIARAIVTFGAVAALVTGVTFAALSNTATLADSTVSSVTANLLVWNGSSYQSSGPGFTVTDLIPGTAKTYPFYLKNADATANLKISAHIPVLPTYTNLLDYSKVHITFKNDSLTTVVDTDMAALNAGQVNLTGGLNAGQAGDSGVAGHVGNYTFSINVDPDAVTGSHMQINNFNLEFTGTVI